MSPLPPGPSPVTFAAHAPLVRATSPVAPLRCGLAGDRAAPPPPRQQRYNPPARYGAQVARTATRPASDGASASRLAGGSDGHDAAGSRIVAGAPDVGGEPRPDGHGPHRGSPRASDPEPRRQSVHRHGAVWQD